MDKLYGVSAQDAIAFKSREKLERGLFECGQFDLSELSHILGFLLFS